MKSVLISIQPKWCELIASGKKTVEVRKTKPKLETPFKVYIYETRNGGHSCRNCKENAKTCYSYAPKGVGCFNGRGKVIGEFVCDRIIPSFLNNNDGWFVELGCLSKEEIDEYQGDKPILYGWLISDLVIYDKPRELSEFYNPDKILKSQCMTCVFNDGHGHFKGCKGDNCWENTRLKRPPQSWCYVERSENG